MNTLKSAALVVILTGVLVGVYVTIYRPPVPPPPGMTQREVDDLGPPLIEDDSSPEFPESDTAPHLTPHHPGEASPGTVGVFPPDSGDVGERNPAEPMNHAPPTGALALDPSVQPAAEGLINRSVYTSPLPEESTGAPSPGSPAYDLAGATARLAQHNFKRDFDIARQQTDEGLFRAALATLSPHYGQADLTTQQQADLMAWLDALAAKVIYSREHHLDRPYKVRGSQERMIDVAQKCGVTAQLLQNINGSVVNNPEILLPGTELKVVPGPFRAEVHLQRGEITLFLNELYAGRFPVALGDEPVTPGQYQIQQKQHLPTYVGSDGRTIAGNDPANPYGTLSLNLTSHLRIHGSPLIASSGRTRGCISLSPKDAEDLFGILTEGSIVVIK